MRRPGCSSRAGERASVTDVENPMDIDGLSMLKPSSSSSLTRGHRGASRTAGRAAPLLLHSVVNAATDERIRRRGSAIVHRCTVSRRQQRERHGGRRTRGVLHRRASSSSPSPRSYCSIWSRGTYDGTYEQFDSDGRAFILIASHCTTGAADDATEWPVVVSAF